MFVKGAPGDANMRLWTGSSLVKGIVFQAEKTREKLWQIALKSSTVHMWDLPSMLHVTSLLPSKKVSANDLLSNSLFVMNHDITMRPPVPLTPFFMIYVYNILFKILFSNQNIVGYTITNNKWACFFVSNTTQQPIEYWTICYLHITKLENDQVKGGLLGCLKDVLCHL